MKKQLKMSLIIAGVSFVLLPITIVLHNLLSGLLRIEEPVFFTLTMILFLVFPLSLLYAATTAIVLLIKKGFGSKKK